MVKVDIFTLLMAIMVGLVVTVVGVSQYWQFSLSSSSNERIKLLNDALDNQTNDILHKLDAHRNATSATLQVVQANLKYLYDNNRVLHEILNIVKNQTHNQK